eukprot:COSAG02_NODE_6677_length_3424_cov_7.159699_3_plen_387_part_00
MMRAARAFVLLASCALVIDSKRVALVAAGHDKAPGEAAALSAYDTRKMGYGVDDVATVDPFRTAFHFQPPPDPAARYSVMNDPNGVFRDPATGLFHMFAQFRFTHNASFAEAHPSGVGWLHAVSSDGLVWRHLPMALEPKLPWECGGIFTGSATLLEPDGEPVLAFSVECNEAIGISRPSNASDPLFVEWETPTRVVNHTPAYNFRDPVTAFRPPAGSTPAAAEEWRMAVGCSGHLCTFRSRNFRAWRDAGLFYRVPGQHMWECPDVYPLPGSDHWVIKVSSAPVDEYVVGRLHAGTNDSFVPVAGASDIGAAISSGQLIDAGNVYASKTFYDSTNNRRILFGWVHEEPGFPVTQRWQGLQTIPRQVVRRVLAPMAIITADMTIIV